MSALPALSCAAPAPLNTPGLQVPSARELAALIGRHRYRYQSEEVLQAGIAEVFDTAGIQYERELYLNSRDRLDFRVGGTAIEVKIKGSQMQLVRQIARYVEHPDVAAVLVVGTPAWVNLIPGELHGKPVYRLRLVGSML